MNEIKCEVIEDLMTLYVDNLSSDESNKIIENHIEHCGECKFFLERLKFDEIKIDITNKSDETTEKIEKDLINNIKKSVINKNLLFTLIGVIIAVEFILDIFIFTEIIILPAIGVVVYLLTRKVWLAPVTVCSIKSILTIITMLTNRGYLESIDVVGILKSCLTMGGIYFTLTLIGVFIGIVIRKIFINDKE